MSMVLFQDPLTMGVIPPLRADRKRVLRVSTAGGAAGLELDRSASAKVTPNAAPTILRRGFLNQTVLELQVKTQRRYKYRTTVPVVARVVDVLKAERRINAPPQVQCVVAFKNILAAVVQAAIPK